MNKHQSVQVLEAASVLLTMPSASLPENYTNFGNVSKKNIFSSGMDKQNNITTLKRRESLQINSLSLSDQENFPVNIPSEPVNSFLSSRNKPDECLQKLGSLHQNILSSANGPEENFVASNLIKLNTMDSTVKSLSAQEQPKESCSKQMESSMNYSLANNRKPDSDISITRSHVNPIKSSSIGSLWKSLITSEDQIDNDSNYLKGSTIKIDQPVSLSSNAGASCVTQTTKNLPKTAMKGLCSLIDAVQDGQFQQANISSNPAFRNNRSKSVSYSVQPNPYCIRNPRINRKSSVDCRNLVYPLKVKHEHESQKVESNMEEEIQTKNVQPASSELGKYDNIKM